MVSRMIGPMQGWAVLAVGIAVSVWAGSGELSRWATDQQTAEHVRVYQIHAGIEDKVREQAMLLQSAAGLFSASDVVQPTEWQSFVDAMATVEQNSGAAFMGYIVQDPWNSRNPRNPITSWQLVQAHVSAQAINVSSQQIMDDPAMKAAMEASAMSNRPTMSAALGVMDGLTGRPLRAICMPIHIGGQAGGWVVVFTSIPRVVEQAITKNSTAKTMQSLMIFDAAEGSGGPAEFGDEARWRSANSNKDQNEIDEQTLMLADREFALRWIHPLMRYDGQVLASAGAVMLVGLIITLLLHVLVRTLYKARIKMEHSARHDALTDLPNRALFKRRLEEAMVRARTEPNFHIAVLFLDFDHFKVINDSLGHQFGDELLKQIAVRLRTNLRTEGSATRHHADLPARLGGDEFVVLMEAREATIDAVTVAGRLGAALAKPYNLMGQEVVSSASIGIVIPDMEHKCAEDVLRDADLAMYHAKDRGRARFALFDLEMREKAVRRLNLEKAMRHAVELEEFYLLYQPIVCLESGQTVGFEALVRWEHPQYGVVSPDEFISVAEETGLIVQIGYWVLQSACRQLAAWQKALPGHQSLFMNVNASRRELTSPGFVSRVEQTLAWFDLRPGMVKLEITESVIMSHYQELTPIMRQLRAIGIPLCMDDFGTGHSSLSCLHTFPIDVLKIDRAFIRNMGQAIDYTAIVQAVVTLAHTLKMTVVAEGIELAAHLAQLQALEVDMAQGYYFAKPMTAKDTEQWVMHRAAVAGEMPQV